MALHLYPSAADRAAAEALTPCEQVLEVLLKEAGDTLTDPEAVWYLAAQQEDEDIQRHIGLALILGMERFSRLRKALFGTSLKTLYEVSLSDADKVDPEDGQALLTDREWIELGEEIDRRIESGRF